MRVERRAIRRRVISPPAWSKCRWLTATTSTRIGGKASLLQSRHYPRPTHAASRLAPIVHAVADPRLNEHAAGRRLDQQAVQRLGQRPIRVDFSRDELVPQDARYRTKIVPASDVNTPAWISAILVPPPRSALHATESFSAVGRPLSDGAGWLRSP